MNNNYKELTKEECINVLCKEVKCRVAMCDNNLPYIVPMNYCLKKEEDYYFNLKTKKNSKKLKYLEKNNKIIIEVEYFHTNIIETVLVYGYVKSIVESEEKNDVIISIDILKITGRLFY